MKIDIKKITQCGVLAAIACVLTMVPQIPNGAGGYVHFGDCIIYLAALLTGPASAAVVGAVGHGLADLFSGYAIFVPGTFIIKGLMGFVIGKIIYGHYTAPRFVAAAFAALAIVTGGYFLYEAPVLGMEAAMTSLISSPIQWLMSVAASAVVLPIALRLKNKLV